MPPASNEITVPFIVVITISPFFVLKLDHIFKVLVSLLVVAMIWVLKLM